MKHSMFPDEIREYLIATAPTSTVDEQKKAVNERFGTNYSRDNINNFRKRLKLRMSGLTGKEKYMRTHAGKDNEMLFMPEVIDYIREIAVGKYLPEITEMVNAKFGTNYKVSQIRAVKKRNKIYSTPGWEPGKPNIGMIGRDRSRKDVDGTMRCPKGGNITSFKKGHKPWNYADIGTVRLNSEGYFTIKVRTEATHSCDNWEFLHRIIYKCMHPDEEITSADNITFLDGNPRNLSPDNLIRLSRAEKFEAITRMGTTDDPHLNKVIFASAKLTVAEQSRKKNGGNEEL